MLYSCNGHNTTCRLTACTLLHLYTPVHDHSLEWQQVNCEVHCTEIHFLIASSYQGHPTLYSHLMYSYDTGSIFMQ